MKKAMAKGPMKPMMKPEEMMDKGKHMMPEKHKKMHPKEKK